jgi:hypothetical protein
MPKAIYLLPLMATTRTEAVQSSDTLRLAPSQASKSNLLLPSLLLFSAFLHFPRNSQSHFAQYTSEGPEIAFHDEIKRKAKATKGN